MSLQPSQFVTGITLKCRFDLMSDFYKLCPFVRKNEPFPFTNLKGKVVLIVNVASKCGFTPQYEGLQELYKKYREQGLVVLAFPCNQFGAQEPGTDDQISDFCKINFGVTFPVLQKIDVNGSDASPVYEFLKSRKPGLLGFKGVKWNFEKFLVDRNGKVVSRFTCFTVPSMIEPAILELL